ncbi:hypothetical protein IT400_01430, partial [Candidatus Nomurabacteria bacterium]|nr:hypothetical protein [Candidatus Nomurabacteria bacterium]
MKKEVLQSIKVTALALILAFSINYVVAWTGPTTNPPPDSGSKNVDGPITVGDNIGGKNQVKLGGVNLGKPTSIGKVTDPLTVTTDLGTITAGLDVDGFTLSKGAFIKGLSIISPASNSYKYDKELFKILDSSWDTTDPVFSVDTRKGADTS